MGEKSVSGIDVPVRDSFVVSVFVQGETEKERERRFLYYMQDESGAGFGCVCRFAFACLMYRAQSLFARRCNKDDRVFVKW
jgi:hypothetical protein